MYQTNKTTVMTKIEFGKNASSVIIKFFNVLIAIQGINLLIFLIFLVNHIDNQEKVKQIGLIAFVTLLSIVAKKEVLIPFVKNRTKTSS